MADAPIIDLDFPHVAELQALWRWSKRQPWFAAEHDTALAAFMAETRAPGTQEAARHHALRFLDWFHFDRTVGALAPTTPAAMFAAEGHLPANHPLLRSRVGAFKVKRTVPHRQAVLVSLADGDTYRVADKTLSVALKTDMLAFGRLFPHDKNWVTSGPMLAVSAEIALALASAAELAGLTDGLAVERAVFGARG